MSQRFWDIGERSRTLPKSSWLAYALAYTPPRGIGGILVTVRQTDAAELIAIEVFNAAQAAGEPVTMALVKRHVTELLAHPPECDCGRCEAAATARVGHIWRVAVAWERSTTATRRRAAR